MNWQKWLEKWDMTTLKISVPFLEMEWKPQDEDKAAAWELYVELLTRITTQPLALNDGDEKTALDSVYALFPITPILRTVLPHHNSEVTKLLINRR